MKLKLLQKSQFCKYDVNEIEVNLSFEKCKLIKDVQYLATVMTKLAQFLLHFDIYYREHLTFVTFTLFERVEALITRGQTPYSANRATMDDTNIYRSASVSWYKSKLNNGSGISWSYILHANDKTLVSECYKKSCIWEIKNYFFDYSLYLKLDIPNLLERCISYSLVRRESTEVQFMVFFWNH